MQISEFSKFLQKLEDTTKRLEITEILKNLINALDKDETDIGIYMSLGSLDAQFKNINFNVADRLLIKALENLYQNKDVTTIYKELGDLGNVVEKLHTSKATKLSIKDVHQNLVQIANYEGLGSQDKKIRGISDLLVTLDTLSAKYITRIILGTTRLGFTELTVVDALSSLLANDKSLKKKIEAAYFIHPDIGYIAKQLKAKGIAELKKVVMMPGIPVLPQKAQRYGGIEDTYEKIKDCWLEFKFDGTRVQLHMDKTQKVTKKDNQASLFESEQNNYLIKTFTRNLEDSSHQFPDLVSAAKKQVKAESVILDGEAIGLDKETGEFLPFQEIMQRKRKHSVKEMSEEIPIKYFAFDVLYLNGESQLNKPLEERNKILATIIEQGETIVTAEHIRTKDISELKHYYEKAKKMNLEGLIVKNPTDAYQAGARSYSWVKLKKADEKLLEDSIDAVVLGYYKGKGDRTQFGIGGFLIGVYDEKTDSFVTVSKVGTGLKDADWQFLKKEADKYHTDKIPVNVQLPKEYQPDVVLIPKIVVEIGADEISVSKTHSAGYALRFPRLLFFRTDKSASQITTLEEIKELYSLQKRGNYVAK